MESSAPDEDKAEINAPALRQTTIRDVAQTAGVSFKTVSRVINGGKNVAPEMRERVEAAIRQLNYRPSLAARQLAGQKSYILALIAPRAGVSYVARMMVAIATEAQNRGYQLITDLIDWSVDQEEFQWDTKLSARPDAFIVIPPFPDNPEIIGLLERQGAPTVRIAGTTDGYGACVRIDDTSSAIEMVDHLLSLGHRRIGMIAPPLPRKASETRIDGYRIAHQRAGLELDPALIVRGRFDFASGASCATELLALTERPTAIFAASDEMALGAMAQAQRLGYAVPGNLAIAGYDDSPMSRMVFPPLTTVRQHIPEIARVAVHAAIEGCVADFDLPGKLIIRGSTSGARDLCLEPFEF